MKNPLAKKILFLKVKNQDKEAFGQFYDLYVNRIYRFIFFKVNSVSDAQDLTSEVFLKLWQHLNEGKEVKNLNSYIYIIARNSVIDFYRQRVKDSVTVSQENSPEISDEQADLMKKQVLDSDWSQVLKSLKKLKDEYREIIILRFLDELTIREIASVLNKSNGSVRVLIHRALKALKENLNE